MEKYKLGIGLAGGVNDDGSLPLWALKRVHCLAELFHGKKIDAILYSTGATHRGISSFSESAVMREETIKLGVDPLRIYCEESSKDTFGNAAFSRILFIDVFGIKNLIVVTSKFHMPKTQLLFNHVFPKKHGYNVNYIPVSDDGLDPAMLEKRKKYEEFSVNFYKTKILPNTLPGDIKAIMRYQFNENPSHSFVKSKVWREFTMTVQAGFSGNPLY